MESCAQKLLETATLRTLHAHSFSRSSASASHVLTDLLSRYLTLLASTSAKHAHHAGRTSLTIYDALGALEELGMNIKELTDFAAIEAKELSRYAVYSTRRIEDLYELRAQLSEGLRQDRDDAIRLVYVPYNRQDMVEVEEDESDEDEMQVDQLPTSPVTSQKRSSPLPQLPLSPISNPSSSPSRKRPRTDNWQPPEHVPDFLPPFPTASPPSPVSPVHRAESEERQILPTMLPPLPPPVDVPQLSLTSQALLGTQRQPQQTLTSAASDYLVQVPYPQSSLSSIPEWHLPASIPPLVAQSLPARNLPTPQTEHSLLAAFHYILTHPPPPHPLLPGRTSNSTSAIAVPIGPNTLHPAKHKVAMTLLYQTQAHSRWEPADSLFATVAPCPPRVTAIGPTYPVPEDKDKAGPPKDFKFPPMLARPVGASERIAPLVSQQTSRIPELARHVLPPMIFNRTSRLAHPPILHRGSKQLTYGPGVPAPWNSHPTSSDNVTVPSTPAAAKPGAKDSLPNGKDKDSSEQVKTAAPLPDAKLYATWDYEPKDYRVPLVVPTRTRTRIGSMASPAVSSPLATMASGASASGLRSRSSSRLIT